MAIRRAARSKKSASKSSARKVGASSGLVGRKRVARVASPRKRIARVAAAALIAKGLSRAATAARKRAR